MANETITVLVAGNIEAQAFMPGGPTLELLGRVLTGDEAMARVLEDLPDVLLLDTRIDQPDARAVARRLREWTPATRVLTVSPFDDEASYTTLVAGATGSILAGVDPAEVTKAIVAVSRRESVLQPRMASRLLHDIDSWSRRAADPLNPPPTLTATEREVLANLGEGLSSAEIATAHAVTEHLVNLHAGFAVAKLHRYVLGAVRIASTSADRAPGG